ncbi:surface protease GP63 [Trypanosoma cruzi]|nr:surface protease GP63 [Trypanosoma cruzi]
MHAALRCLGMQVRLRVTEEGNIRCVSCTDGATIAWATRPYAGRNVICRGHAQVCTISATSVRLLPVVPWDGEERAWSRTIPPASTEQGLPGASVPVAESIETGRGTPPKDADSAAPQASIDRGEVYPARRPRQTARSFSRRQGLKQRDGRQVGHASDSR